MAGDPIYAIATAQNGNRKIGPMLQVYIIPGGSPLAALKSGKDAAVCGDCAMRGDHGQRRACYVYMPGVDNIWQARHKAAKLTPAEFAKLVAGLQLRIGAYGDPVAVPLDVWMPMLDTAAGWTAYSHAWRRPHAQPYRAWCMASVDSEAEQQQACRLGWRTFRVRGSAIAPVGVNEVVCPASEEGGHRTVCANCELCRGRSRESAESLAAALA